jgi:hypothetical protein
VRSLLRDPRVTCLVEQGTDYLELRGVSLSGHARLSDDPQTLRNALIAIMRQLGDPSADDYGPEHLALIARNRVAIRVRPARMVACDHRKVVLTEAGQRLTTDAGG